MDGVKSKAKIAPFHISGSLHCLLICIRDMKQIHSKHLEDFIYKVYYTEPFAGTNQTAHL